MSQTKTVSVAGVAAVLAVTFVGATVGAQEDDLDCGEPGTSLNMAVPDDDPHGLDADDDGIGCEDPSDFDDAAPADLDCGDPGTSHNMAVGPDDPHDLDANGDGVGCEDAGAFDGAATTTTAPTATTTPAGAQEPARAPVAEPVVAKPRVAG